MALVDPRLPHPDDNFQTLKEDAAALLLLVDKYVKVKLIKKVVRLGFLHSVDPVSHSVILSIPEAEGHQTILMPGNKIIDITEMAPVPDILPPIRKSPVIETSIDNILRKKKIIAWLKSNLLPVTEDGDNILFGNANLLPPYTVMDICTENTMVAMQMRKIIAAMPPDYEPN